MKKILLTMAMTSSLLLGACSVSPRERYTPYEWKTIEGLRERQQCLAQCPTYDACAMSYLRECISTARQIDMLGWNKQNGTNQGAQ